MQAKTPRQSNHDDPSEAFTLARIPSDSIPGAPCVDPTFSTLASYAMVGVAQVGLDGRFLRMNRRLGEMFGYSVEEMCGRRFADLTHPHDLNLDLQQFHRLLQGDIASHETRKRYIHKDGSTIWGQLFTSIVRHPDGTPSHLLSVVMDVSRQVASEQALSESESRLALAARGADDALWDWDLTTNRIHYSPRWAEIVGYTPDELGDSPDAWFQLVRSNDLHQLQADLALHLSDRTPRLRNHHRLLHKDGDYRWVLCRGMAVHDARGHALRIAGWITDVTVQKQTEHALRRDAMHDRLTGLPNRPCFRERLQRAIHRARHDPRASFAVLLLDFDRFKVINDSLGHGLGDQLLVSIAQRLGALVRGIDVAARLGGDEFVVLLDSASDEAKVRAIAARLVEAFDRPHLLGEHEVTATASIGVALGSGQYATTDEVIRDADAALRHAKDDGRGRYAIFNPDMHQRAVRHLRLEKDLRRAIDRRQLHLAYQPIICLYSGDVVGVEALLRWRHPDLGMVPPDQFIPLAEETGLILPIGAWVLEEACRQLADWKRRRVGPPRLSLNVNISKRQLFDPGIVGLVERVLDDSGVAAQDLRLEITESIIMAGRDVTPTLRTLREIGVGLAMDDFGTGHSSLSRMHQFPIDVLKIDKQFVRNIDDASEFAAVVQAIVTLAHALNIEVVAEGIETPEQLAQLEVLDCDHAQGYYFARPLPAAETEAYLRRCGDLRRSA